MDKKSKYTQPPSNKGAATDSKKNQDVAGKVLPRTSRKREPTNPNGCSKNEQSRKLGMQKSRAFDKRPKPKGQYYGGSKENTKVDDSEMAEHGSVMVPGSKKQNLNHLLNFHYESRDVQDSHWNYGRPSSINSSNRRFPLSHRHKYNKELFLQANCQFVVNINGDYSVYLVDPDILVDWKLIEQIRIFTSESVSCPICLSLPVAGRMTRCGHVYCWPCILHYLSLSDKSRKCPICFESVDKSDLKSVIEVTQNAINTGDNVQLRLMRRKRGSLLAMPVEELESPDPDNFFTVSQQSSKQIYSKLLLANVTDVLEIIDMERTHLNIELMEDPHAPENCFIEQALEELLMREQSVSTLKNLQTSRCNNEKTLANFETPDKEPVAVKENIKPDEGRKDLEDHPSTSHNLPKYFYFYQAEDGQHVYLHAMNVKMLELQYGTLENCPRLISGKVLEKEVGSFTEDLRRRLRYLCHLPLTCSFEIAEIEMKTPLVSKQVIELFQEQVDGRVKRRRRLEREENKREKKINVEENKKMGRYRKPKAVDIESLKQFPQWLPEPHASSVSISTPPESVATSSLASSPAQSSFDDDATSLGDFNPWTPAHNDQGPSFAQMLRNEGSRMTSSRTWPTVRTSGPSKGPESNPWGRKSQTPTDKGDCASAPIYTNLGDVLAQALEQSEILNTSGSRKTKKKREKSTV